MYKKIYIENFRCFRKLVLDDLQDFNLILGKNNVGKTALLEAIFLHLGTHNPEITFKIDQFRGITSYELKAESVWAPLFYNLDIDRSILIRSFDEHKRTALSEISISSNRNTQLNSRSVKRLDESTEFNVYRDRLKLTFSDTKRKNITAYAIVEPSVEDGTAFKYERPAELDFRKGMFISTLSPRSFEQEATRFSKMQVEGKEDLITEALLAIEPRIKKLFVVSIVDKPAIYVDIGLKKAVAINFLGEGVVRLLQILLALAQTEDGTVLIDEIERGFHYQFYSQFLRIISDFAHKLNIQIIATTHNKELLYATNSVFNENQKSKLSVMRLDKINDEIKPTYYTSSELKTMIDENWEIR